MSNQLSAILGSADKAAFGGADNATLGGADSAALGGADKAALVLLALGSDRSAALLSGLAPEETARLSEHLSRLADVDRATRDRVLEEFRQAIRRPPTADLTLAPAVLAESGTKGRADRAEKRAGRVRALDLSRLERVPSSAISPPRAGSRSAFELPQDLPISCRAELVSLRLPVSALSSLALGDVLLLKSSADTHVDLVGGQACRLAGRLCDIDGHRAIEILPDPPDRRETP